MKKKIRLTEGDLRRIVNESVKRVLREEDDEYRNEAFNYRVGEVMKELKWAMTIIPEGDSVGAIQTLEKVIEMLKHFDDEHCDFGVKVCRR